MTVLSLIDAAVHISGICDSDTKSKLSLMDWRRVCAEGQGEQYTATGHRAPDKPGYVIGNP